MHDRTEDVARAQPLPRVVVAVARGMALLGGLVLGALILLTVCSVAGRALNGFLHLGWVEALAPRLAEVLLATGVGPVLGDYELVEAGVAFAVFAFLPLAQVGGAHASVDILTARFPGGLQRLLAALWEGLFAAVLIVIALRLYDGMLGKMRYNETTFLMQFPVWWAYAASLAGASVAALVAVATAAGRLLALLRAGRAG